LTDSLYNYKQFASACISECKCNRTHKYVEQEIELHRPDPVRSLKTTCAAVELPYDTYKHTYLYSNCVFFVCRKSCVMFL